MLVEDIAVEQEIPIMMTYFVLQIPNIVIIPSIEDLQNHFGKVITNIIETHKKVFMWGQRYSSNGRVKALGKTVDYNIIKHSNDNNDKSIIELTYFFIHITLCNFSDRLLHYHYI